MQNRCNPFERHAFTTGVVDACAEKKITFLAHSPVGGHRGQSRTESDATLCTVGARHGLTPYQVCLAWLLTASPSVVVIPGASRPVNARSSAAARSDCAFGRQIGPSLDRHVPHLERSTQSLRFAWGPKLALTAVSPA